MYVIMGSCLCCEEDTNILATYDPMVVNKTNEIRGHSHTVYHPPRLQEMSLFPNG